MKIRVHKYTSSGQNCLDRGSSNYVEISEGNTLIETGLMTKLESTRFAQQLIEAANELLRY
jgi:hypothetical protein